MGCSADGPNACSPYFPEEQPAHLTFVDAFALDTFEVTVGRFRAFAQAYQGMAPPQDAGALPSVPDSGWQWGWPLPYSRDKLLDELKEAPGPPFVYSPGTGVIIIPMGAKTWTEEVGANESLPINFIDWPLAFAFCIWDGGRLPTEAEWECAAKGGEENRPHPWGSEDPSMEEVDTDLPMGASEEAVWHPGEVGLYPKGKGRWGHLDLAGGVLEWTLDQFSETWYAEHSAPDSCHNCANVTPPEFDPSYNIRVFRGGYSYRTASRGYNRYYYGPTTTNGFRCARPI